MDVKPLKLDYYLTPDGRSPYRDWFYSLMDIAARQFIRARLVRVERGLLGDFKPVGCGVHELRIDKGPGYRIYFGRQDDCIVLLLLGGSKVRQGNDIAKARSYWADHLRRRSV